MVLGLALPAIAARTVGTALLSLAITRAAAMLDARDPRSTLSASTSTPVVAAVPLRLADRKALGSVIVRNVPVSDLRSSGFRSQRLRRTRIRQDVRGSNLPLCRVFRGLCFAGAPGNREEQH